MPAREFCKIAVVALTASKRIIFPETVVLHVLRSSTYITTTHLLRVDDRPTESTQLRSFWELESLGISEEEKTLYNEFATNITF